VATLERDAVRDDEAVMLREAKGNPENDGERDADAEGDKVKLTLNVPDVEYDDACEALPVCDAEIDDEVVGLARLAVRVAVSEREREMDGDALRLAVSIGDELDK
jgi:hypothetical protein